MQRTPISELYNEDITTCIENLSVKEEITPTVNEITKQQEEKEENIIKEDEKKRNFGSGTAKIDIHIFDQEIKKINIPTRLDRNFKTIYFSSLKQMVNQYAADTVKDAALEVIDIIYRDMETPANFLGSYADDILVEISILLEKQTDEKAKRVMINNLAEQFFFMKQTNGYCPSGRSIRTYQIYQIIKDIDSGACYPKKKEGE